MIDSQQRIAIIGASGAMGTAFVQYYLTQYPNCTLYALSRSGTDFNATNLTLDFADEASIETAANDIAADGALDKIIVATGTLHTDEVAPEKALKDMNADNFATIFTANTTGPALVMKHFLPLLDRKKRAVFATLSARVGSISDNFLGGWYAYRASKAALNMLIKTASIEMTRRNKESILVGLHPGTVDSKLSKPFQSLVKGGHLFTPKYAVEQMAIVLENLEAHDTGKCFAYDGTEVPA